MAFTYKRSITIDHTRVSNTDQTSFPVLVSLSDTTIKSVGNGGHVQSSTGYDIYFYSDSALTTRLSAERESFDAVNGALVAWVKIPTLSHTVDTVIYIGYGDSSILTDPNSDVTYGKTTVWDSNFKAVYHFPNGTTLTTTDSTSNTNNLTATGTPTAGTGKNGGGVTTSSGNYLSKTLGAAIGTTNSISAWFKMTTINSQQLVATAVDGCEIPIGDAGATSNKLNIYGSGWTYGSTLVTGTWYYVTVTRNGTTASGYNAYLNGVLDITTTRSFADSGSSMKVGMDKNISAPLVGTIDEVRVSNAVRSVDWIVTDYNNQNNPGNIGSAGFYTVGTETSTSVTQNSGFFEFM